MNDIFISYKNEDRPWARKLAGALQNFGYNVWWDREISPGQTWDEVIEEAIANTKCVIVLWSIQSVKSSWVKNEADEGLERRILLPVMIEDVKIPLAYRRIQTASLIGWDGDLAHREFKNMLVSIERISGKAPKIDESVIEPEKETVERVEKPVPAERKERPKKASHSFKSAKADSKSRNIMVYVALAAVIILGFSMSYRFLLSDRLADNKTVINQMEKTEDKSSVSTVKSLHTGADVPLEADTISRAKEVYSDLKKKELDPGIRDIHLLSEYKNLWKTFQDTFGKDTAGKLKRKIEALETSVHNFRFAKSNDKRETATVYERMAAWINFFKQSRNSPEKKEAEGKIEDLKNIIANSATILKADDFINCTAVDENTMPSQKITGKLRTGAKEAVERIKSLRNIIGNTGTMTESDDFVICQEVDKDSVVPLNITDKFSPGADVTVWALINAPKSEDLQMIWYADGKEVQARIVVVSESSGFRTCDVASSSQYIGLNEVRLYNSHNILIGRNVFSTSD